MTNPGESDITPIRDSQASRNTLVEKSDFQNQNSGATASLATPAPAQIQPNQKVSIEVFRALLGIPQADSDLALKYTGDAATSGPPHPQNRAQSTVKPATLTRRPSHLPKFLRRQPPNTEYETSVYYSLIQEESWTWKLYYVYDILVYSAMICQLIIAAVLIILGATAGDHHIAVAVLGAVTGVITGVLSLIKGQGLPNRLLQYVDGLRKVRDNIEFTERELRAGAKDVIYDEVVKLRNDYETARDDALRNHPDSWTSFLTPTNTRKISGVQNRTLKNADQIAEEGHGRLNN